VVRRGLLWLGDEHQERKSIQHLCNARERPAFVLTLVETTAALRAARNEGGAGMRATPVWWAPPVLSSQAGRPEGETRDAVMALPQWRFSSPWAGQAQMGNAHWDTYCDPAGTISETVARFDVGRSTRRRPVLCARRGWWLERGMPKRCGRQVYLRCAFSQRI